METKTSLYELFGKFAEGIKYLITGDTEYDLEILDLTDITANCKYNFKINNIRDENEFEHDNVFLYPNIVFDNLDDHKYIFVEGHHKVRHLEYNTRFKYDELLKLIRDNYPTIIKNGGIINYSKLYSSILKEQYKFKTDENKNTVYCPAANLLVQLEEDTDRTVFSNLEILESDEYDPFSTVRVISLDEYKAIKYITDNLK